MDTCELMARPLCRCRHYSFSTSLTEVDDAEFLRPDEVGDSWDKASPLA